MEEEKKTNKRIVFSIVAVILLVAVVAGATYAYFSATASTNTQTVTTANLELTFDDGTAIINASNIIPITTDEVLTKAAKKSFTIKKTTDSEDLYVKITLTNINLSSELGTYDFKWALYQGDSKITTGDFGSNGDSLAEDIVLATNQLINSTTGITYDLYMWINETGLEQNDMMNQTFSAKITATGEAKKQNTLASVILGENNANVLGSYNFNVDYTCEYDETGEEGTCTTNYNPGLFVQKDDVTKSEMGFPTYYYRGNVTNNYVKFGKYVTEDGNNTIGDDIIWRIVRINEDGSVKLITQNPVSGSISWANYPSNADYKDSNIIRVVAPWYYRNLNVSSLKSKIVTSGWCSDSSNNYTAANTRLNANNPTFVCSPGSYIDYRKVGLITADEVVFSGALRQLEVTNNITYLDNNISFYTITPAKPTDVLAYSPTSKRLIRQQVNGNQSARAVINLSSDVIVSGGDGLSADTAYVIK